MCKCLFSKVTVQAVTELDNKAAHCHTPVPQRHRPFLRYYQCSLICIVGQVSKVLTSNSLVMPAVGKRTLQNRHFASTNPPKKSGALHGYQRIAYMTRKTWLTQLW